MELIGHMVGLRSRDLLQFDLQLKCGSNPQTFRQEFISFAEFEEKQLEVLPLTLKCGVKLGVEPTTSSL